MEKITPVYILSGFLGSGKTTLLQRLLALWQERGLRPAVIMNEIGDVNLDGLLVSSDVPMAEMIGGCICCTIRGDLSVQMAELISKEQPDLIVIEATGAGNPLEIFDAVTEVSLYLKLDIKPMITVVDALHFADLYASQKGKTYRLMLEQIRCGSVLVLNKIDLLKEGQEQEIRGQLQKLNPYADIISTVKCGVNLDKILSGVKDSHPQNDQPLQAAKGCGCNDGEGHHHCSHHHDHDHHNEGEQRESGEKDAHPHASHEHVTVYTHYFHGPIDSNDFEQFIAELPRDIYRGKGILQFSDTASRFLFQYAYREADYLKITPQGEVPDVAVFIGEHFDKNLIAKRLNDLEQRE
ncbi:CobW family GTP-binding protein [Paenibacillus puldeungensis]|uniref:CobW family GTP-binding protein n=1 Tax=Paenibacillus puldeungensis TaxID=696536 RepID=A0ABW3RZX0_9BACL